MVERSVQMIEAHKRGVLKGIWMRKTDGGKTKEMPRQRPRGKEFFYLRGCLALREVKNRRVCVLLEEA